MYFVFFFDTLSKILKLLISISFTGQPEAKLFQPIHPIRFSSAELQMKFCQSTHWRQAYRRMLPCSGSMAEVPAALHVANKGSILLTGQVPSQHMEFCFKWHLFATYFFAGAPRGRISSKDP